MGFLDDLLNAVLPTPSYTPLQKFPELIQEPSALKQCSLPDLTDSVPREIESITMKRKHIDLDGEDKYGHWWMELGEDESYGWWPSNSVGLTDTLSGTTGELNGQTTFGGSAKMDPHHGDTAEEEFHPKRREGDNRSDEEITQCLRNFATDYDGEWRWTFGYGQNCHTFQEDAMEACAIEK